MTHTKEEYEIVLAEMPQADIEARQWFLNHHEKIKSALQTCIDNQWQPIQTAPKDGTNILLGCFDSKNHWCCSSFFLNDRWVGYRNTLFTHWQKFPEPDWSH